MLKILSAILLFLSFSSAHAYDLYFTVSYQSHVIPGASGNKGCDVIFEKKIIHIKAQDDSERIKIKKAYRDYVKSAYPVYVDRIMKSNDKYNLDGAIITFVSVDMFGSVAKAKEDRESSMEHARDIGFTVIESDGFKYKP